SVRDCNRLVRCALPFGTQHDRVIRRQRPDAEGESPPTETGERVAQLLSAPRCRRCRSRSRANRPQFEKYLKSGFGGAFAKRYTATVHRAAVIESTRIVLRPASSVPVIFTFRAANFPGVFWSLSAYTSLPSYRTYEAPWSAMQAAMHSASVGPIRICEWSAV